MHIIAIACVDEDWGIGYQNQLLFHLKRDLRHFQELTTSHNVIMGRNTWESLPNKPLKNRKNIVISKKYTINGSDVKNTIFVDSLYSLKHLLNENEIYFVIGGGSLYNQLLPYCEKAYITYVHKKAEFKDAYFPNLNDLPNWICNSIKLDADIANGEISDIDFCEYINKEPKNILEDNLIQL